jgi:hypothetical protein
VSWPDWRRVELALPGWGNRSRFYQFRAPVCVCRLAVKSSAIAARKKATTTRNGPVVVTVWVAEMSFSRIVRAVLRRLILVQR